LIQLPMMIFFHPMAEFLGMEIFAPFPKLWVPCSDVVFSLDEAGVDL
jgi:hypothetical protein